MIYVIGAENTQEHAAALDLRDMVARAWPEAIENVGHNVYIISGAQCHGQVVREIDLIVLANLGPGMRYSPFLTVLGRDNQHVLPEYVNVRSLCAVIEVKDHPPEAVRFVGTAAEVRYQGEWKSATEQNHRQLYSVQRYLRLNHIQPPWITPLVWLRNVPNTGLPRRPHNLLGAEVSWELFLNVIGQTTQAEWINGVWTLDAAGSNPSLLAHAADLFTRVVTPTRLDRARMERLNQRSVDLSPIEDILDHKLVILRGRGGTGKTMRLLQMAKHLLDQKGARVLILTYNKALVADIRRLLTIIGISDDITGGAIQVQTVHSFLHGSMLGLELINQDYDTFLEDYDRLKDEALDYLRSGAVSTADIAARASLRSEPFTWDYVFVDEGQDWPNNERDLLLQLYPYHRIVVADGVDQLVRSSTPVSWRDGVERTQSQVLTLKKTLRMKAGLSRFVSTVAGHLGLLNTEWEANQELPGGRVILIEGPYLYDRGLHDQLVQENQADGNSPVDMLFCVPPALVIRGAGDGESHSVASRVFSQWGYSTWDGASDWIRESYATDLEQLRIVQYESCRGLEGWTVVNLALDRFYEHKLLEGSLMQAAGDSGLAAGQPGVFSHDDSVARRHAARWTLIPLTRAIDTLVIQIDTTLSPLRTALEAAAATHGEYVTWVNTQQPG